MSQGAAAAIAEWRAWSAGETMDLVPKAAPTVCGTLVSNLRGVSARAAGEGHEGDGGRGGKRLLVVKESLDEACFAWCRRRRA